MVFLRAEARGKGHQPPTAKDNEKKIAFHPKIFAQRFTSTFLAIVYFYFVECIILSLTTHLYLSFLTYVSFGAKGDINIVM